MAWTAPTTRATGDLITASIYNTDVVDNLAWLKANTVPLAGGTMTGTLTVPLPLTIQASGVNGGWLVLTKPASGSTLNGDVVINVSGQKLRLFDGGAGTLGCYIDLSTCAGSIASQIWHQGIGPYMKDPPYTWVKRATNQTIATATLTAISFSAVQEGDSDFWSAGSPTRLTVPSGKGGVYMIAAEISLDGTAGNQRQIILKKNNTANIASMILAPRAAADTVLAIATLASLAAADYMEVIVYHDTGGNQNATAYSPESPVCKMVRVGD